MKTLNKSDFIVATELRDINTGRLLPLDANEWEISLYVIKGVELKASFNAQDGLSNNCEILPELDENGEQKYDGFGDPIRLITIYVDGFDWKAKGALHQYSLYKIANEKFTDGFQKLENVVLTDLVIC